MSNQRGLPLRPRLLRYFDVVPMSEDRIQLRSTQRTVVLSGKSVKAVARLLDLLDGTRELADITRCFPDIPKEEVLATIRRLTEKGLVEDISGSESRLPAKSNPVYEAQVTFFSIASRDGRLAQDIVGRSRVAVFGLGRVGSHVVASLARAGVGAITGVDDGVVEDTLPSAGGLYLEEDVGRPRAEALKKRLDTISPGGHVETVPAQIDETPKVAELLRNVDLALVCRDAPEVTAYRSVNTAALQVEVPWLRVSLEGIEAQLGPTVMPHETACYTCYELRTKANWSYYDEDLAFEKHLVSGRGKADYGCLAPVSGFLGNLAALESMKLLTGFSQPVTCGRILTFDINTFDAQIHNVLKLPRCPTCGSIARSPTAALWSP